MFLKLYFIALPVFFIIDMIWLGLIAKNFYRDQIGFLLKSDFNILAAVIFYLLFIAGLVIFVISPAVSRSSLFYAIAYGAFFGLVAYATYDLTNLATIKNWSVTVTIVDMIWGAFLGGAVSVMTYILGNKLV